MTRTVRRLAALALLGLSLSPVAAMAQAPEQKGFFDVPPPEAPPSGDPLYGYIGTAFLAAAAIFAVCKSSRR